MIKIIVFCDVERRLTVSHTVNRARLCVAEKRCDILSSCSLLAKITDFLVARSLRRKFVQV